jgi:hypothetical protein
MWHRGWQHTIIAALSRMVEGEREGLTLRVGQLGQGTLAGVATRLGPAELKAGLTDHMMG